MDSNRKGLGSLKTEGCARSSQLENPHSSAVFDRRWMRFSFPTTWHYDVLRGLDYLRSAKSEPDERAAEAVELVAKRRHQNGRWPLDNLHPDPVRFDMEGAKGTASRWITLRALRMLGWYSARDHPSESL
jgi:hypothetical protein